ncbi:MAG: hypothetical protein QN178_13050 [Armatimonadota bacterium]|nr:hypothetical protein [Armatimonadota bacterium]
MRVVEAKRGLSGIVIPTTTVAELPDRIIVATAPATKSRLLTKDAALGRVPGLVVVW